jgi:hypothetical protein
MLAVVGRPLYQPTFGSPRLFKFAPVVLIEFCCRRQDAPQAGTLDWSLPGYPASYLQQIKVKNGNYPELNG